MILPFAHHLHEAAQHGECRPVIDHLSALYSGGGRGIRTPEWVPPLTVFKTAAFNRSAIPPFTNVSNSPVFINTVVVLALAFSPIARSK